MRIYRIAQNLRIEREDLPDRTRILLKDGDKEIGKLVVQYGFDKKNYYLQAFKIAPQYQRQGWGTKMINAILNDTKFQDRPIVVQPAPYGNEIGSPEYMEELMGLEEMYSKFGFVHGDSSFMIRYPKKVGEDKDLQELQRDLSILQKHYDSPEVGEQNQILDLLGSEKYPRYVRVAVGNIINILEDRPELASMIPSVMDEYFSSYSEQVTPKYLRSMGNGK